MFKDATQRHMYISSILIILLLGFIAYQLYTRNQKPDASTKSPLRGTFSGAFSEAEIDTQQQKDVRLQEEVAKSFVRMQDLEKKEIMQHAEKGDTKENFRPSQQLIIAITTMDHNVDMRQANAGYASRMIEANAAVLNGKPVEQAQKEVWAHTPTLGLFDAALAKNGSGHEKAVAERKEYWMDHWDSIVEENR